MRIGQKSHNNVTKTVYVWFEFLWIRRYIGANFRFTKQFKTQGYSVNLGVKIGVSVYMNYATFILAPIRSDRTCNLPTVKTEELAIAKGAIPPSTP